MKISVRNLGIIGLKKEESIDLKPLTILIGPNNAGKSWLAYTIAGIFGRYGWAKHRDAYMRGEVAETFPELEAVVQDVIEKGAAVLDLLQFVQDYEAKYINSVAYFAREWMQEYMSTEQLRFDELAIRIDLAEKQKEIVRDIKKLRLNISFPSVKAPLIKARKELNEAKLYFHTLGDDEDQPQALVDKLPTAAIREFVFFLVFQEMHQAIYHDTRLFPTERTTFITFPFKMVKRRDEAILTDLEDIDIDPTDTARPPYYPVSDFIGMIVDIYRAKRGEKSKKYVRLSHILQEHVLGGSVVFSTPEPGPEREMLFSAKSIYSEEEVKMEMPIVSSMVKELAPLALYLRCLAHQDELLVIDEPEMHLHPRAQVQMLEFLAMLVNAGLPVLVTTHSPYFLDHLPNLIKASKHENKEAIRSKFFLQDSSAFISQNDIAVYLVENGEIKNAIDEQGFLEWSTFTDVSNHISDIYFEL